ncbi:twin-arginine translocation signal domain-containing protein [Natronomonas halophila]|uniref:twin-arginine translocation signal domain-containing protein n=1 Tax=Natronomonas halophila TaxID=2747817 RepID=UPI0015B47A2C|nr:twin-arginine translocation signal domain-containing protein [Natronomonas halophila]QLD87201.1 twin-arginine translocation signal domain-containing protein [Natronomonas halophila]
MALHNTRRRFLGGLAAGTLVGTAGCLRQTQERLTSVDAPDAGPPTYRRWLPAPEALPGDDDEYGVHYLRMSDVRGDETTVQAGVSLRNLHARTGRDPVGIDAGAIEEVVKVGLVRATVLIGAFDTESVAEGAVEAGYEPTTTDGEFTIYERSNPDRAIAVAEETVVHSHDREDPRAALGAVLDARRGEADRYHEVDSTIENLTAAAGAPTFVWLLTGGGPESIDGVTDTVSAMQFDGDRAVYAIYYLFESEDAVSTDAVREQATQGALPRTAPLDIEADGRTVTVEYARSLADLADEGYALRPLIAWDFSYDAETGDLTITHRAGDEADAEALTVEAGAPDVSLEAQFADEHDVVGPGDSITISVEPGTNVRIRWQRGDYGSQVGRYRVESSEE